MVDFCALGSLSEICINRERIQVESCLQLEFFQRFLYHGHYPPLMII